MGQDDLKQQLLNQALRLMQDPRVMKAMQNPKVMQGVMSALSVRAKVQQNLDDRVKQVAKRLNLATVSEVRELKRVISRLERDLDQQRRPDAPAESESSPRRPRARKAKSSGGQ